MVSTSSLRPDHILGADRLPKIPRNAPEIPCFRLALCSTDRMFGSVLDGKYKLDFPVEIGDGYHVAVETCIMSGTTAPTAALDRVYNFNVAGMPLRNNYNAGQLGPESNTLFTVPRATDTLFVNRNINHDTVGTPSTTWDK